MARTTIGIVVLFAGALVLEFVSIGTDGWPTISVTLQYLGLHWNPFVMYVCGVLVGHWFLKPGINLAQYIGEAGELFIVCWIGWGIFWFFYARQNLLPLDIYWRTAILAFAIAVGALVWTIESDVTFLVR